MTKKDSPVRILLRGPFSPYSGYGRDLIGLAGAFSRAGVDLRIQPNHVSPPLPQDVAMLLTKENEAPFDIVLEHVDPFTLALSEQAHRASTLRLGWTMWEFTELFRQCEDGSPDHKALKKLNSQYKYFDGLFVYDELSKKALGPVTSHYDDLKVEVLQGGFDPQLWKNRGIYQRNFHEDRLGFIMNGALSIRKNPMNVIQAFRNLKVEYPNDFQGARLSLHTMTPGLHPAMTEWCPDMKIFYESWNHDTLMDFYELNHVLLAPSWGEGKNLPALEFLTNGGTVAVSDFGGHQQWLDPDYAYAMKYDSLEAHATGFPNAKSCRVSVETIEEHLLHMYRNRDEIQHKAELGSKAIPQMMSWDVKVEHFFTKVSQMFPDEGQEIYSRFEAHSPSLEEKHSYVGI